MTVIYINSVFTVSSYLEGTVSFFSFFLFDFGFWLFFFFLFVYVFFLFMIEDEDRFYQRNYLEKKNRVLGFLFSPFVNSISYFI